MSTSCILVRSNPDRPDYKIVLEGVRVNWSGYPEYMVDNLRNNWNDTDLVGELFGCGEISELGENWEDTVLYNNSQSFQGHNLAELKRQAEADYVYYFDTALGCWI